MDTGFQRNGDIKEFFELLDQNDVEYVLLGNINNELPDRLMPGKGIKILVNENSRYKFDDLIKKNARKYIYPYGKKFGWHNLYDLPEFEFWRMHKKENFFIEVTYRLCCKGLMPNTRIPLDNMIQDYLWKYRKYDEIDKWWTLDNNTKFVYCIVRCVFDIGVFSSDYKTEILDLKPLIDRTVVVEMFNNIFFEFSAELLYLIDANKLDDIRKRFISYKDY